MEAVAQRTSLGGDGRIAFPLWEPNPNGPPRVLDTEDTVSPTSLTPTFDALLCALRTVEQQNLRVKKIIFPRTKLKTIVNSAGWRFDTDTMDWTVSRDGAYQGTMFGADVFIGDSPQVFSEPEFATCAPIKFNEKACRSEYIRVKIGSIHIVIPHIPSEERAINTLREEISETDYRRYIARGFINVPGASGRVYQIFRRNPHVKVWLRGTLVEEICIVIQDSRVPPTDKLIAFKTMIEADEEQFRKFGNVYKNTNRCLERVRAA